MDEPEEYFFIVPPVEPKYPLLHEASSATNAVCAEVGKIDLHVYDVLEGNRVRIRLLVWPDDEFISVPVEQVRDALSEYVELEDEVAPEEAVEEEVAVLLEV